MRVKFEVVIEGPKEPQVLSSRPECYLHAYASGSAAAGKKERRSRARLVLGSSYPGLIVAWRTSVFCGFRCNCTDRLAANKNSCRNTSEIACGRIGGASRGKHILTEGRSLNLVEAS